MGAANDFLELSILFDVARGFLGLRDRGEVPRHAALSFMGACGTSRVAVLEPESDGRFVLTAARGLPADSQFTLLLPVREARRLVRSPGPHRLQDVGVRAAEARDSMQEAGFEWIMALPRDDCLEGMILLGPKLLGEPFSSEDIRRIQRLTELAGLALAPPSRPSAEKTPLPSSRRRARGAGRSKPRVSTPTLEALRGRSPALSRFRGEGPSTIALFRELELLAETDLPVLIQGETGTGKELVARALHELSPRREDPFEAVNCGAIPGDLVASALFGHERGAFTGAASRFRGAFERAGEGSIFLDEVSDMPLQTQAILLRVLQEREFRRVGGEQTLPARARVISASNRDLAESVRLGQFRSDLFYRLQMYSLRIPPLRQRKEEIPLIVAHLLETSGKDRGARPTASREFLARLERRNFPGNVRELEALVLSAAVRAGNRRTLQPEDLAPEGEVSLRPSDGIVALRSGDSKVLSYGEMEREYVRRVLQLTEGNVKEAAKLMGVPRTTLNARIRRLGIESRG
jgi:DNA-binding NtrC family response regulator